MCEVEYLWNGVVKKDVKANLIRLPSTLDTPTDFTFSPRLSNFIFASVNSRVEFADVNLGIA